MLGNVITFNSLYKKIEEATEAENTKEIYFWYGRFTILFIDIEPIIEEGEDEFGFDDNFMSTDAPMVSLISTAEKDLEAHHTTNTVERRLRSSSIGRRISPKVQGLFGNSFALANGFMNSSFGDASPNAQICETNITRMISYGMAFVDQV